MPINGLFVIGLTGPSGAGKSVVSAYLCEKGISIVDADQLTHTLQKENQNLKNDLVEAFSDVILSPKGEVNRTILGKLVFNDPKKLKKLNQIIFSYIAEAFAARCQTLQEQGERMVIFDAPTLFESGIQKDCDCIIGILAPYEKRLLRLQKRDQVDSEVLKKRLESQKSDAFFKENCDYILYNNGSLSELYEQVDACLQILQKEYKAL